MDTGGYSLRPQDYFSLSIAKVRTELGEKSCQFAAPSSRNRSQTGLNLKEPVSLNVFKAILKDLKVQTSGCNCFN